MTQRLSKMMNSNKRKGRMNTSSNKLGGGRSKYFSEKNVACNGIYGNSRAMYTAASLVGCVVQIQVYDGNVYEGVLRTFSHQLDLVLELAHKVPPKLPVMKGVSSSVRNLISSYPFEGGLHDKLIFRLQDIVSMQASNVDTDYPLKDAFTDTAISKFNGQVKERELEPWQDSVDCEDPLTPSSSSSLLNIEDDCDTNGWDANDMFRTNAEKYGVQSSYDNSLTEYTVPLTKKDTEEWKQAEAKALKIAQEIETNTSYQSRIQLENGDEEDRFSAVVRSAEENTSSSKYILPQKRRNNAPGSFKRHSATSSSPVHLSLKPYSSASIPPPKGGKFNTPPVEPPIPPPVPAPITPPAETQSIGDESSEEAAELSPPLDPPKEPPTTYSGHPPKMSLPPRIERRRENERKFHKQQKGRMDEIEDFKKFSKNFNVLTEEVKECPVSELSSEDLSSRVERTLKLSSSKGDEGGEEDKSAASDVVKFSTLNPNAKEFVFNPNAKAFTPRSMQPPPVPPPSISIRATPPPQPLMTPNPSPQMMPAAPQPLFTAMAAPQHHYVMQAAPVSVAIGHHPQPFATAASSSHPQQRFRKASAQSILAPGPSQLTLQYTTSPQGVLHAQPQPTALGYPQMNFVVGPRAVVSPQPVGVIPTSHSAVSYCDASHLQPTHLIMSAHPGASAASTPHSIHHHQGGPQQQHHPPQSQTPVLHHHHHHPSPVHNQPPPPVYSHHHHHPSFPPPPPQQHQVLLMQQTHHHQAASLHHHVLHHQNHPGLMPHQMALLPTSTATMTSAPSSLATPPYVQQHP